VAGLPLPQRSIRCAVKTAQRVVGRQREQYGKAHNPSGPIDRRRVSARPAQWWRKQSVHSKGSQAPPRANGAFPDWSGGLALLVSITHNIARSQGTARAVFQQEWTDESLTKNIQRKRLSMSRIREA
jgi:hypothetical protein